MHIIPRYINDLDEINTFYCDLLGIPPIEDDLGINELVKWYINDSLYFEDDIHEIYH